MSGDFVEIHSKHEMMGKHHQARDGAHEIRSSQPRLFLDSHPADTFLDTWLGHREGVGKYG